MIPSEKKLLTTNKAAGSETLNVKKNSTSTIQSSADIGEITSGHSHMSRIHDAEQIPTSIDARATSNLQCIESAKNGACSQVVTEM